MSNINKLGYGPLEGLPVFFSSAALGTTPVKVTLPIPTSGAAPPSGVKIKIVNGHASQFVAWSLVRFGASAPSITADFVNATGASIVAPMMPDYFSLYWGPANAALTPWFDLYVVASGASTPVSVTFSVIT